MVESQEMEVMLFTFFFWEAKFSCYVIKSLNFYTVEWASGPPLLAIFTVQSCLYSYLLLEHCRLGCTLSSRLIIYLDVIASLGSSWRNGLAGRRSIVRASEV